jgi:N-acetylglutamate synthase-like GNAT family acetyltransferase
MMKESANCCYPRLFAYPLKSWERGAVAAALAKAGLANDDVEEARHLFWRFETDDEMPVGFGGLELYGQDALLRSIVTLPPMRNKGIGTAIVAMLETEAGLHGSHTIWIVSHTAAPFFERRGYAKCEPTVVPHSVRATREFQAAGTAEVLVKLL